VVIKTLAIFLLIFYLIQTTPASEDPPLLELPNLLGSRVPHRPHIPQILRFIESHNIDIERGVAAVGRDGAVERAPLPRERRPGPLAGEHAIVKLILVAVGGFLAEGLE